MPGVGEPARPTRTVTRAGQSERQLGQVRPVNTSNTVLYTPRADIIGVVTSIIVVNTNAGTLNFRLFHDADGTTYDQTTAIAWDEAITFNALRILTFDGGIAVTEGGNLACRSSAANDLTFTAYGYELSRF